MMKYNRDPRNQDRPNIIQLTNPKQGYLKPEHRPSLAYLTFMDKKMFGTGLGEYEQRVETSWRAQI